VFPTLVVAVAIIVCGASVLPAASYSTTGVDRGASLGVADDPDAMLGLVITDNVSIGENQELVTVTNRLDADATVTVALHDDSTSKGTLSVKGGETGDTVSFTLADGSSETVYVDVANESSIVGDELIFRVSADSADVDGTANDRRTDITE
jgi:hypothetical protein